MALTLLLLLLSLSVKRGFTNCQLRVVSWCELVPTDKNQLTTRNLKTKC